ncbi:MAG: MarR family winged helix-turn-helix transcriptional regulator [Lachnospirales bacterium]
MIHCKVKAYIDNDLKKWNVTSSQVGVLWFLRKKGGSANQKEIEKHLNVAHSTTIGMVSRLEKKGFVTVSQDENDRRYRVVTLTDKAYELHLEIKKNVDECERKLLSGLSPNEVIELKRLLNIVHDTISDNKNLD